jgi:hypothetical protein
VTVSAVETLTGSTEFGFQPEGSPDTADTGDFTATVNCRAATVTFEDETDYTDWDSVSSRTISVQPPTIPGSAAPAAVTSSTTTVEEEFEYTNVVYTGTLTAVRTRTVTVDSWDFQENDSVRSSATADIDCGQGVCEILPCLDAKFNEVYNEACTNGGWHKVSDTKIRNLQVLTIMLNAYDLHSRCGNTASAQGYLDKIQSTFGESCACGCADGTNTNSAPKAYTP